MSHRNNIKNDACGMRGPRSRNENGSLRAKRGDTQLRTIEHRYGIDLGFRGDMRWDTYKYKTGVDSINDLITGK